jgi:hypothetical protein
MAFMRSMAMPVVEIVDVIVVGDGDVSAAFPMRVIVSVMLGVALGGALVEVPVVSSMKVSIVDVVDMVAVGDSDVSAAVTVNVAVVNVLAVSLGHRCSS